MTRSTTRIHATHEILCRLNATPPGPLPLSAAATSAEQGLNESELPRVMEESVRSATAGASLGLLSTIVDHQAKVSARNRAAADLLETS
ncbi:hypothetical protein BKA93DRAFT_813651 [Sparassis latifolia]